MNWLEHTASDALRKWGHQGLERTPATFTSAQDPVAVIDGKEMVLFSSSNYLGLSTHPSVVGAARDAVEHYGAGSGGSRLTTGSTALHQEVEQAFAQFLGYPEAVFFSSGFQANTAVLQTLADANTVIISDERNHASIIDGCRLAKAAGATVRVSRHRDPNHVDALLKEHVGQQCLVVTDGLFSMDGTLAPLPELIEVSRHHGAALMVDDAHGTGTLGTTGRGVVEHFGMHSDPPDILVATASKALGAEGGVVATSETVAALLRQKARTFVYSTSSAPATCASIRAALHILESPQSPVGHLHRNVDKLANALGIGSWPSPIIPIVVGDEAEAMRASRRLADAGFYVPAIRYPTVPRGSAMLRVTAMATHTPQHIAALVTELQRGER